MVSVVYESDVNTTALGINFLAGRYLTTMDSFPTSSLRYGSPTHLDGLVFTLEPMTTQTHMARLSHDRGEGLVFPGIQPLWWLKSSRDGNTDYS